jgi:cell wall-associated NlpC family hydrolase
MLVSMRTFALLLVLTAFAAVVGPARAAATEAYVDVSVATLWVRPGLPRPIDAPSLTDPVGIARWTASLTTDQRRWLVGKLETQVLYGTRVLVLERRGAWSRIVVPSQPTPRDRRGYPGWLPSVQVTASPTLAGLSRATVAIVTARTAWLRSGTGRRILELSFGTRLPVVATTSQQVRVATPHGSTLTLARSAVALVPRGSTMPPPSGAKIVSTAQRFTGVRYLWAGVSAWGFDCSGLTYAVYRRFGITLPRDADAQARAGRAVSLQALAPGHLVFFAGPGGHGTISHVAIYAGDGKIVESPASSSAVRTVSLASRLDRVAAVRRYL